jgi:amino acid adenylation domain-containing protein
MSGNVEDIYELSPLQRGILLHSRYDGAADMYLSQQTYSIDGPLDVEALLQAWRQAVAAHPSLRTSFHWDGLDKPLQVVHKELELPVVRNDWRDQDAVAQEESLEKLLTEDRIAGFDPAVAPLERLNVVQFGDDRHTLVWTYHHLLMDGWSVPVFLDWVMARYRHLTVGTPAPTPVPPFRDYIAWLQRQDLDSARKYWMERLAGVSSSSPVEMRPADLASGTGAVERCAVSLPEHLASGMRQAAARHRVTVGTLIQATWATMLAWLTGRPDVVFGCASSGRPAELPRVETMIGLFANTLPVPINVPDDGDLGQWLRLIQDDYAAMRRYEHAPLSDIKKWAGAPGQDFFDSLLVLENHSMTMEAGAAVTKQLSIRMQNLYDKINLPLTLTVTPEPVSQLILLIHQERFGEGFTDRILAAIHAILEALITADRIAPVITAAGPWRTPDATASPAQSSVPGHGVPHPREQAIAAVFQEILDLPEVDPTESFFALGGDSFGAVRVISRIEGATIAILAEAQSARALAYALEPDALTGPDAVPGLGADDDLDDEIAELERLLAAKRAKKTAAKASEIPIASRAGSLVCTPQQEGLWFMHQLDPASSVYHVPAALRLRGDLDVAALNRALQHLVLRHEVLRTRFIEQDGRPRQVIDPAPPPAPLPVTEVAGNGLDAWVTERVGQPFDLTSGPLFRAALARLGPRDHALVLVVHHIVADGWSVGILAGELSALYGAESAAPGSGDALLPPTGIQPADHAAWQRDRLDGGELERQIGFWRETLSDLPTVGFPADRPRPAQPTGVGTAVSRMLPGEVAAAARDYARANQISLLAVLQAALATVMHRYTNADDLPIGSIFGGRTRADLEPVVGFFANTLVLRADTTGNPTFTELVRRCNQVVLSVTDHQDVPFGLVVDALAPERVAGRNPLFQIALMLQPWDAAAQGLRLGDVSAELLPTTDKYSRFDMLVIVGGSPDGGLDLGVEYSIELFDADRIERLVDHFTAVLAAGTADPGIRVDDIDLLPDAERLQVLRTWNDTAAGYSAELLHKQFEAVADRTPGAVAVIDHDGTTLTYRELDERTNQLAHRLRRHGVQPDVPVGICLDRGADLVIALLATWKAGGGCLPLNPDLPKERIAFMLADAAAPVVLTHDEHARDFASVIAMDSERNALAAEPVTRLDGGASLDSLAYVLYTSGSTGVPKGVWLAHRGINKQVSWMQDTYHLQPDDKVLQKTPYSFDVSVWEFFWPLSAGAAIVVAEPGGHGNPGYLARLVAREGVTTMHFVPTMLQAFLSAVPDAVDPASLATLRLVFASGEALPPDVARRFLALWPGIELHNLYGPTEASIDVTSWRCLPDAATVPIGNPISNMRTYVLDGRLRPAPIGVPGELFVGGPIAHGYLGRPGLTAQRFLADPHVGVPGQRMYATGDVARWRADGLLEYLGRNDRQVKVRGQRVELGEIEHALAAHPGVRQCAVLPRRDSYLAAYIVGDASPADLREHLAARLPTYMIPAAFVTLPALPLTPNGKLDTAALPDPEPAAAYVAPRTPTEQWLAAAWAELLPTDAPVSATDNFFDLGGNSLHGTQLIARVRDTLHLHLDPRHLFTSPTLEQLATRLEESEQAAARPAITVVPREGPLPCTYQQEGLWFLHQLDPASATYHIPFALRLRGDLDIAALERAMHALAARHEALRTRFTEDDGRPRQVVGPPPPATALPVTALTEDGLEDWVTAQASRPFNLATGPVFRTALARLAPADHALILVVHHIVADGWSARILAGELSALYDAEAAAPGSGPGILPPLRVQPADHAAWQRAWLDPDQLDLEIGFWREHLAGLPTIDFPADRSRPVQPTGAGEATSRWLPAELAAAALGYARDRHVSYLAVLQAALLTVLHRYTGADDLPIGSIFAGRTHTDIEPAVGFFANTLVLRASTADDPSFADLIARCHDTVITATAHLDMPFALIVDALAPERVAGRNPLFQISLTLQPPAAGAAGLRLGAITADPIVLGGAAARFDIAIAAVNHPDGQLELAVEYSAELFDPGRIERLLDHLTTVLTAGLASPATPAGDLDLMTAEEQRRVLHGWDAAGPVTTPHEHLGRQA